MSQTIHARLLASLYLQAIVLTHYISQYVVHMIDSISLVEPTLSTARLVVSLNQYSQCIWGWGDDCAENVSQVQALLV